jgi:hypothetical protein
MTWRMAFRLLAQNFRARAKNAKKRDPKTEFGAAWTFDVCAEELEYAASLTPHSSKDYFQRRKQESAAHDVNLPEESRT